MDRLAAWAWREAEAKQTGAQKTRAYFAIRVLSTIYVSSSGHYFAKVVYNHHGNREVRSVAAASGQVITKRHTGTMKMPAYVLREIRQALVQCLMSDRTRFYEVDRDGNNRYDHLLYYDPEQVAAMAALLQKEFDEELR